MVYFVTCLPTRQKPSSCFVMSQTVCNYQELFKKFPEVYVLHRENALFYFYRSWQQKSV